MTHLFWQQLAEELAAGRPAWLVLVVDHGRGSPGTAGARMFVRPDGSQVGTIGGGIMESRKVDQGVAALASGPEDDAPPRLQRLRHRRRDPGAIGPGESGLICSGWQYNLTLTLRPKRDRDCVATVAGQAAAGRDGAFWVDRSGLHCTTAPADLSTPRICWQDGADWVYREQFLNRDRLAIIGAGHCGRALCRVMASVGWHVTLIDHRAEALEALEADAVRQVADYREAGALLEWPEFTAAVVMTTNVDSDIDSLEGCVSRPLRFLGVMGSAAKIRTIRRTLSERGVSDTELKGIRAPVGLPMKSDTPAEIAISVAAQLLALDP